MANVKGAGMTGAVAAHEWQVLNDANKAMIAAWARSPETQVNLGRQIGVKMAEWVE